MLSPASWVSQVTPFVHKLLVQFLTHGAHSSSWHSSSTGIPSLVSHVRGRLFFPGSQGILFSTPFATAFTVYLVTAYSYLSTSVPLVKLDFIMIASFSSFNTEPGTKWDLINASKINRWQASNWVLHLCLVHGVQRERSRFVHLCSHKWSFFWLSPKIKAPIPQWH